MRVESNFTLEDYVRILNQYQELQQENQKKLYTSNGNKFTKYELLDDYERILQENQQLKEELRIIKEHPFISKFYKKPYVIIRNENEIKINEYGFDYLIKLENILDEIREITKSCITSYDFGGSRASLVQGFYNINDVLDKVKE